ncbi:hypothetical protein CBM2626_U40010 [Cupriavidus taiwanensis]|uniref:Uncharacterized protein n=1 Tax=Cupriavidus taiwanensis TaxID=164546 RepID=A0A375EG06_9BURK|nr:hypothetical protein [Cupriavidus taiwanensis]SOZ73347.1 hypothetical protein CBM2614_U40010 [Cupriavidus taiwanensis]SOZ73885.1 hypothetical protein CBM2615_U30010 [Cupriavidus taiwanensis]SOZ75332.1 hypothetical protein CBM2613_U30010 [Cupriavidus taiwanensis]SPA03872.1 hypothetical protein CBM2626_U40010 [Cupriavidus taiwanensis]SPA12944.1 hypothetical protein CBM2625_U70010 [Cupriavidus taiwanensis]
MTSDYVKHRLQQKAALAPRGDSNWQVLELCREFAQEAFVAGISMAFQDWVSNYVSPTQRSAVRRYLIARLPGIILNQYLPAQKILDPVDLAEQLSLWSTKNPTWKADVEEAAFDPSQLCEVVNRLYYSLLEFAQRTRN